MPFIVSCPTCRHQLSVVESPAPYVVACPTCRYPLTVPAATINSSDGRGDDFVPVRNQRRPGIPPVAIAAVLCLAFLGVVGVVVWQATQPSKQSDNKEQEKTKRPSRSPVEQKEVQTREVPPPPPPPAQAKSREELFEEAWVEAEGLGKSADKAEPTATEKALGRLTASERVEASNAMFNPDVYLERGAPDLKRLGLTQWLARESRKKARISPEFKGVVSKLWDPAGGAPAVLAMMDAWGEIPLYHLNGMVRRVQENAGAIRMTPEERNAVLLLGGSKWLDSRR